MSREYGKLLLDPRWVKKRKRILKRDEYKCTVCGSKKLLEVHHTFYYSDKPDPWKYPDDSLLTLCLSCHNDYHEHFETEIKDPPGKKRKKKLMKVSIVRKKKKPKKVLCLAEIQEIRGLRVKVRQIR